MNALALAHCRPKNHNTYTHNAAQDHERAKAAALQIFEQQLLGRKQGAALREALHRHMPDAALDG